MVLQSFGNPLKENGDDGLSCYINLCFYGLRMYRVEIDEQ